jgi:hypothetical protein
VNETLKGLFFHGNRIDLNLKQFIAESGLKSSFTRDDMNLAVKPTVTVIQPGDVIDTGLRGWRNHTHLAIMHAFACFA